MAEGNEFETEVLSVEPDMINVSGVVDEPLWVAVSEIAAIGIRGAKDTLVVLKGSGMQLVAKSMHPNEVLGMIMEGTDAEDRR